MTPTPDDIVHALAEHARPIIRQDYRADSCIVSTLIGIEALRYFGIPAVAQSVRVRAFNHTGPGQSTKFLVPGLAARVVAVEESGRDTVAIGNVDPVRDYTDVRDVVRAYRLLVLHGESGGVYNVCSGVGVSVAEIAHLLLGLTRQPLRLVADPDLQRRFLGVERG